MSYAQTNYQEKLGNSGLTIAEAGCFVTADCNLLLDVGQAVDPWTLDQFYLNHGLFTYDTADRANDDITWGTVTRFNPNVVVDQLGAGWPQSNFAIVKFVYKSHSGFMVTHFCKVHDWSTKKIVDSWDGQIKTVGAGTYYGEPVAYATYRNNTPAPAPAPSGAAPAAATQILTGKKLFLPAAAGTWRVYKLSGPYTTGNEIGKLTPGNFPPGLTYDILGTIAPSVVKIHTETYGDVAIYVGSNTIAQFVTEAPAPPPPAPAPTPPAPEQPKTIYTKLASPQTLVTNKQPTHVYDLSATTWAGFKDDRDLPEGNIFVAVGKAQHPLGGVYFMDAAAFGDADTSGTPAINEGVNTVDLSPAPAPEAPAAPEKPAEATPAPADGDKVPVTVNSWQNTYKDAPGVFKSVKDVVVKDVEGKLPDQNLGRDVVVKVAGSFSKDGQNYYRTAKSATENAWYGIPVGDLIRYAVKNTVKDVAKKPAQIAHQVVDDIDAIAADLNRDPDFARFKHSLTPRGRAVANIAEAEEKVESFIEHINIFKKKYK